jgi:hypothetical protein
MKCDHGFGGDAGVCDNQRAVCDQRAPGNALRDSRQQERCDLRTHDVRAKRILTEQLPSLAQDLLSDAMACRAKRKQAT